MTDPPPIRASLRALSQATGYSLATVSMALRDVPRIPEATRHAIQEAARKLGYTPNARIASTMRQIRLPPHERDFDAVAWLYEPYPRGYVPRHDYLASMLHGVRERAEKLGWHVEPFDITRREFQPKALSRILYARGIQAAVLAPFHTVREELRLNLDRLAVVALGHSLKHPDVCRSKRALIDNMGLAFHQLKRRGYRRPGLIMWEEENLRSQHQPWAGFNVMKEELAPEDRLPVLRIREYNKEALLPWIREHRPDVIVGGTPWVYWSLLELGVDIPGKMGFLLTTRTVEDEGICGLDPNYELKGASGVELAIQLARHEEYGVPEVPRTMLIASSWREGGTLRPPRDAA